MPAILAAVVLLSLSASGFGAAPAEQPPRMTVATPVPSGMAVPTEQTGAVTVDVRRLDAIEALVREAIAEKKLPGAVVLVGRGDRILYQKAIGNRALVRSASAARKSWTLSATTACAAATRKFMSAASQLIISSRGSSQE